MPRDGCGLIESCSSSVQLLDSISANEENFVSIAWTSAVGLCSDIGSLQLRGELNRMYLNLFDKVKITLQFP